MEESGGGSVAVEVASQLRTHHGGGRITVEDASWFRTRRGGGSRWRMKWRCWTNLDAGGIAVEENSGTDV